MKKRRTFLKSIAGALPVGLLASQQSSADEEPVRSGRDYFAEIGVKPIINAAGAYSALGGARMRPEVVDAMRYAATHKVKMSELIKYAEI